MHILRRAMLAATFLATQAFQPLVAGPDAASAKGMSAKYAAFQAMNVAITDMEKDDLRGKQLEMEKRILEDVPGHKLRGKSEALVREWARKALVDDQSQLRVQIWEKFQLSSNGVAKETFERDVAGAFGSRLTTAADRTLNDRFGPVFAAARASAIAQQRGKLNAASYPSQEEANRIDREGWASAFGRESIARLEKDIARSVSVVFEENENEIRQLVTSVKEAVDGQRQRQLAHLTGIVLADGPLSAEAARSSLEENIRLWLQGERGKPGNGHLYQAFPSVAAKLVAIAEQAEMDRFVKFLEAFTPTVNADALRTRIRNDTVGHRDRARSQDLIARELAAAAGAEAIAQYTSRPVPGTDMTKFRERLKEHLRKGPPEVALWSALGGRLAALLDPLRNQIAQEQLQSQFGPVATKVWAVPETELKLFVDGHAGIATFEECMRLPDIKSADALARDRLLLETESLLVGGVGKLIEEGKRAWGGQSEIVKRKADPIHRAMTEAAAKNQLGAKDDWIKRYAGEVLKEWVDARVSVIWRSGEVAPVNAASKYSPIFEEMNREIRKTVTEFYDDSAKPRAVTPIAASAATQPATAAPTQVTAPPQPGPPSAKTPSPGAGSGEGKAGTGGKGGGHPGSGGNQPHPSLGGRLVELILWPWLLLLLLILAVLGLWYWWWRRRQRAKTDLIEGFLGPYDVDMVGGIVTLRCRGKPDVWKLVRVT